MSFALIDDASLSQPATPTITNLYTETQGRFGPALIWFIFWATFQLNYCLRQRATTLALPTCAGAPIHVLPFASHCTLGLTLDPSQRDMPTN